MNRLVRSSVSIAVTAASLGLLAGSAAAAPNLVVNGSFESSLAGWTSVGSPQVAGPGATPISVINYNSNAPYPSGAFGEPVAPPTNATLSPDAAGVHGAYFVDDHAVNEGLLQTLYLTAGNYQIGFDVYAPANGYSNTYDGTFSATIANVVLANYAISTRPATTWTNYSGTATVAANGFYNISFLFNTPGLGVAKDVVVDRVYVLAGGPGGRVLPEPGTLSLLGLAMAGLAATRLRRKA